MSGVAATARPIAPPRRARAGADSDGCLFVGPTVHTPVMRKGPSRRRRTRWVLGVGGVLAAAVGLVGGRFGPHSAVVVAVAVLLLGGALWVGAAAAGGGRRDDSGYAGRQRLAQASWGAGRELAGQLVQGVPPPALTLWGLVLLPGEVAYLDVPVFYSRFCALDPLPVTPGRSVYYLGGRGDGAASGGLVVAATASLIAETVELSRARDGTRTRWRGHQHTRAVVTDRRLLVLWHGRWLPYTYSQVLGFYPDLEHGQVRLEFRGACAPVRLQGSAVPSIAAVLCWALHGPAGLRSHPGLLAFR